MVPRDDHLKTLKRLLAYSPVVALLGARQVGKTTLSQQLRKTLRQKVVYFDLENPEDEARLGDPMLALKDLRGLVIIDEVQRHPKLFPILRVLVDRPRQKCRFLILGSASPDLLQQSSETLAGRISFHELGGLSLDEVGPQNMNRLWWRGGFPRSFLGRTEKQGLDWRQNFVRTFLERDIPALGLRLPAATLRRFWIMLTHCHGQVWNASQIGQSLGVAHTTVRRYLDLLTDTFMIRQLPPWQENIRKRQVKAPKIYFTDSGLLHTLMGLKAFKDLQTHPRLGASWEGFALNCVLSALKAQPEESFFWATHASAELDLLLVRGQQRLGFEFKRTSKPGITRSMVTALEQLHLSKLYLIYPGQNAFPLAKRIVAVPLTKLHEI